jgi:hypothetical protein
MPWPPQSEKTWGNSMKIEVTCPFCEKCWPTSIEADKPTLMTCLVTTGGCGSNFVVTLETEYHLHTFSLNHWGKARKDVER